MPVDSNAPVRVSAYNWVPPFARGLVRDLRVRWALEELGRDYAVQLLDVRAERPADYLLEQPFGQVPAYSDAAVQLFESGAIALHIAESSETLLPRDAVERARAITWLFAAINSIEPPAQELAIIGFNGDAAWAQERRPAVEQWVQKRLAQLSAWLGDKDWLEGRFTIGDLMMVTVLRMLRGTGLVEAHPNLVAYLARGEARPAFQRALDAQMADFEEEPVAA